MGAFSVQERAASGELECPFYLPRVFSIRRFVYADRPRLAVQRSLTPESLPKAKGEHFSPGFPLAVEG